MLSAFPQKIHFHIIVMDVELLQIAYFVQPHLCLGLRSPASQTCS
jgi:hypothetical protein